MQGDQRILDLLNELLTLELTAINQYFAHTRMLHNWGYGKLAEKVRKQAFDEMKDAEEIIDRILFLDGVPNLQRLGTVSVGETPVEQLRLMLETERSVLRALTEADATCREAGDIATREFLAERFAEEEQHVDWLETELGLVETLGEQLYLAQQLGD